MLCAKSQAGFTSATFMPPLQPHGVFWVANRGFRRASARDRPRPSANRAAPPAQVRARRGGGRSRNSADHRSEEHTSELQSLMRISYAVFCLKQKNNTH